jgi:hypothetical protein
LNSIYNNIISLSLILKSIENKQMTVIKTIRSRLAEEDAENTVFSPLRKPESRFYSARWRQAVRSNEKREGNFPSLN